MVIFRTVGEQQMAALYNLQAIRRGTYADPEIFANDIVVVGRFARPAACSGTSSRRPPLVLTPIIALVNSAAPDERHQLAHGRSATYRPHRSSAAAADDAPAGRPEAQAEIPVLLTQYLRIARRWKWLILGADRGRRRRRPDRSPCW